MTQSANPYEPPLVADIAATAPTGHPRGFWFIFWGEFAERSSYYGMRAILSNYMKNAMGLGEAVAGTYMSLFIAGCYFMPLLGGYLADKFFGRYWTIVGFSIPYILGHFILGIESLWAMVIALVLLAMGSGMIKPNISSLMGMTYDQQRPGQTRLRSNAFAMYYLAVNIGAAVSSFSMPALRDNYGYAIAFLFPTALMAAAFIVFASGKKYYAVEATERTIPTPDERRQQRQVLRRLLGLFVVVSFFWAIFDQSTSTWIFFGDVYMDGKLFGLTISAEQMQAWNPLLIVALLPGVTWLWNQLEKMGVRVRATDKMIVGFVLTAITMGLMSLAGHFAGAADSHEVVKDGKAVTERIKLPEDRQVSLNWQAAAYLVLTVAEILISVTGLELAFVSAPQTMKSFITAVWYLTVFAGNLVINAPVTRLYARMEPRDYFGMLTVMMVAVTIVFFFVARRFNAATEAATGERAV
jgi:POT family proton-dependent oligopeptide transporter